MQITELARVYLEQMNALDGKEHVDARKALYDATPADVKKAAHRLRMAVLFAPENARHENRQEHLSPSGKYKLVVTPFSTGPNTWSYSQGLVYRKDEDQPIAEVQRNYRAFPYAWVEGHEKGDFLVCGENYQGQTVINLQTSARRDYLPDSALRGHGFCWAAIHPSPDGKLLAVEGCYWGASYELRFYDFSHPMLPPWPQLSGAEGELSEFFGWTGNDTALIGGEENYYEPLNLSEHELYRAYKRGDFTKEQYEKYEEDGDNWKDRRVNETTWKRPAPLAALTDFIRDTLTIYEKKDYKVPREYLHNARALLLQLSAEESEAYLQTPECKTLEWAFGNEAP